MIVFCCCCIYSGLFRYFNLYHICANIIYNYILSLGGNHCLCHRNCNSCQKTVLLAFILKTKQSLMRVLMVISFYKYPDLLPWSKQTINSKSCISVYKRSRKRMLMHVYCLNSARGTKQLCLTCYIFIG